MSGPAIHHLIAERLRMNISQNKGLGNIDYRQLQDLFSKPENLPYYYLGCQGPDFLFFNSRDWNPAIGSVAAAYFDVYDTLDNVKEKIKSVIPDAVLKALEGAEETVDGFIEDSVLFSEIKQTFEKTSEALDSIVGMLTEAVKKYVTDFNLFKAFDHPYRDGVKKEEDEKWWWFDALHYRKSGDYLKKLLESAPKDSPLYLYALGYLTHYSADTVGHPFVNLNCGGSYRSHSQRHKTSENYHDVFIYDKLKGKDFNHSAIHWLYNFNYEGQDIKPIDDFKFSHDHPDLNTNLFGSSDFDNLAKHIKNAINAVYQEDGDPEPEYGKDISEEDINNAYRMYYKWLKSASDTGTLPDPIAYSFSEEIKEIYEKAVNNLENVGEFLEDAMDKAGKWGLLGLLLALAALVIAAAMAALAIADAVLGALATMTTAGIRAAACLIYEHVYNAYQNFRLAVSVNGLAYPMKEHLNEPRFEQFQSPAIKDFPGGRSAAELFEGFPYKRIEEGSFFELIFHREKHMVYPLTQSEANSTKISPKTYVDKNADFYAFGNIPFSPETILDDIQAKVYNGETEQDLKDYFESEKITLGNATKLIEESYKHWNKGGGFVNFNLDGDRGYGYPTWTQVGDKDLPNDVEFPAPLETNPVKLKFI